MAGVSQARRTTRKYCRFPAPPTTGVATSFHRALCTRLDSNFDAVVGFNKIPGLDVYYAADPLLRGASPI